MNQKRTDFLQSAGTVIALVISIIAMITSIYEASILEEQQKSMVWPYLGVSAIYTDQGFSAKVYNNGTGPAIVKSVEVRVDSKPVESMLELIKTLMPKSNLGYDILRQNKVNNYVFRPGEEVEIIGFPWTEETRELDKQMNSKVQILICYESVLGESWVYDSKDDSHREGKFKAKVEYKN